MHWCSWQSCIESAGVAGMLSQLLGEQKTWQLASGRMYPGAVAGDLT